MVPLCCDSPACHQAEEISWLEISIVLVRDVSDSIPALAQGKAFLKGLSHLPDYVSGWIPRQNRTNLGTPQCSHLPTPVPLHWGHCMRECSEEISKLLLTQLLLASGLGSHKGKPVYMAFIHVSASESCWKRARRLQSRRSLVSPLDAGVCVLLKGNGSHWIYFLFSSPLPLWQLLLVSTCGCLLPVTHPKPSLPRTHLHI